MLPVSLLTSPPVAVLDANVLFPFTLRDTLLRAAARGLYRLRWSIQILDEMENALVREGVTSTAKAARLRRTMEGFFKGAMVEDFETLIGTMPNHPKDRHVAAEAVKADAKIVVTAKLKDFIELPGDLIAVTPGAFLSGLWERHASALLEILGEQSADLDDPPVPMAELLEGLAKAAPEFVRCVRKTGLGWSTLSYPVRAGPCADSSKS